MDRESESFFEIDQALTPSSGHEAVIEKKEARIGAYIAGEGVQTPCVIEASAGTGKSFTLIVLYLRFLLGGEPDCPPLDPGQIVLITFTVAAAEELRQRLSRALAHFSATLCDPAFKPCQEVATVLQSWALENRENCLEIICRAQRALNDAPITTLHGFCKMVLEESLFQTPIAPFFSALSSGSNQFLSQCAQWWSQQLLHPDRVWQCAFLETFPHVEALQSAAIQLMERKNLSILGALSREECVERLHQRVKELETFKTMFYAQTLAEWEEALRSSPRLIPRKGIRHWPLWLSKIESLLSQNQEEVAIDWGKLKEELNRLIATQLCPNEASMPLKSLWEWLLTAQALRFDPKASFLNALLMHCRSQAREGKDRDQEWSFQDLIDQLAQALEGEHGKYFSQKLAQRYRLFMIDECQDVDGQQQHIIKKIVQDPENLAFRAKLIFVGDPKQSIYAFRGADIFEYFKLLKKVSFNYQLTTNYRATNEVLQAVQCLWRANDCPFVLKEVALSLNISAPTALKAKILVDNQPLSALVFHTPKSDRSPPRLTQSSYRHWIAQICAQDVARWLSSAIIETSHDGMKITRAVVAEDIVILVQNWIEAEAIKNALKKMGLRGFYSSDTTALFHHRGVKQLHSLVLALLDEPYGAWRRAVVAECQLLQEKVKDSIEEDVERFETACLNGQALWKKEGIFSAILALLPHSYLNETIYCEKRDHENMRALHQALQWVITCDQKWGWTAAHQTLLWLEQEMQKASKNMSTFFLNQPKEAGTILIVSIFKSKGLEYPMVWIPFASAIARKNDGFFHDALSEQLYWSNSEEEQIIHAQFQEHFSEQMRLFYVASTRASLHLSMGAAPVYLGAKKTAMTDAHLSPLGYLVQSGKSLTIQEFEHCLEKLIKTNENLSIKHHALELESVERPSLFLLPSRLSVKKVLSQCVAEPDFWKISSYSQMTHSPVNAVKSPFIDAWKTELGDPIEELEGASESPDREKKGMEIAQEEAMHAQLSCPEEKTLDQQWCEGGDGLDLPRQRFSPTIPYDPFDLPEAIVHFSKGAQAGSCLHEILESWDFSSELSLPCIQACLKQYAIDDAWGIWVQAWMHQIAQMPLWAEGCCLSQLKGGEYVAEMKFMLSISKIFCGKTFEKTLQRFSSHPLHPNHCDLSFPLFYGGIQGFLDLVFQWKGKYYVLDYKSNWLGDCALDYHRDRLPAVMDRHRYDVQAALYTVALDRHLQSTIEDYDYEKHFGGAIYYFIRGAAWLHGTDGAELATMLTRLSSQQVGQLKNLFGLNHST